jgi:hypothetical protein
MENKKILEELQALRKLRDLVQDVFEIHEWDGEYITLDIIRTSDWDKVQEASAECYRKETPQE